jgi:hypothetical protein
MPAIDQDGLSRDELEAVRAALARDPALAGELDLILPALGPAARTAFWAEFARACDGERPAAAVLTALTRAARGS